VAAVGPFARATLVAPLCAKCADQEILVRGGAIVAMKPAFDRALFSLGTVTITAGAVGVLAESAQHAIEFLSRHVQGDWGRFGSNDQIQLTHDEHQRGWEATDDSGKINKSNMLNQRDTIMSEYVTSKGKRLWVLTRLIRSCGTTIMLPEEY
jgi:hypothetical protein